MTTKQRQDRLYREQVVNGWGWQPGTAIKLTTTAYARTYLTRYSNRRQLLDQIETGVVLFQTSEMDIAVAGTSSTSVWIINRRSGETLWSGFSGGRETGEFVQIVDGPPLELALHFQLSPATGLRSTHYLLFSLEGSGRKLLSLQRSMDFGQCPSIQEDPGQSIGEMHRGSGPEMEGEPAARTLIFPQESVLTPLSRQHCVTDELRTATSYVCNYSKSGSEYECRLRVDKPLEISSLEELRLDGRELSRDEAAWIVANLDKLERHGFRLSAELVERLQHIAKADSESN